MFKYSTCYCLQRLRAALVYIYFNMIFAESVNKTVYIIYMKFIYGFLNYTVKLEQMN